jgi:hypothetical protein
MVFIIANIAGSVLPLFVDGWAAIDFTTPNWHDQFQMNSFNDKIFKGLKKDELHYIGHRMRLKLDKTNEKGKTSSKTIPEMKETIKAGWSGYFSGNTATTSTFEVSTEEPKVETKKYDGMKNFGEMMECFKCGRGWPNTQGFKCGVCHRTWTPHGIKDPAPDSIDLIDLLDLDKLIKQSLFNNILKGTLKNFTQQYY